MKKIVAFTLAYNAENTLRRAVDSIINQTYDNFVYYLVDNGSRDGTRQLIEQYSKNDKRIMPFYYDDNNVYRSYDFFQRIVADHKGDYMVVLDSDDEYKTNFFEDMVKFSCDNGLEFAAGGSTFIDATSGRQVGIRGFSQNILIADDGFAKISIYYAIIRTVWCKFISLDLIKKIDFAPFYNIRYGADTAFCLSVLEKCDKFGILAGTHHNYYVNPKSDSYTYDPKRIKSDQILLEAGVNFIVSKLGHLTLESNEFLLYVYLNAIRDTLVVILNAKISDSEKLRALTEMFTCAYTQKLAAQKDLGKYIGQAESIQRLRNDFFTTVAKWLLALHEVPDEQVEDFCTVGEFVCAATMYADGWIFFKKLLTNFYIQQKRFEEASTMLNELEELLPNDKDIIASRKALTSLADNNLSHKN